MDYEHATVPSAALGCRQHPRVGRREIRGSLRYTVEEWAVIVQAAASDRMRPGAWAQQAAYEAAVRRRRGEQPARELIEALLGELRQHRRVLANIGGNLNDVARAANATGVVAEPLAAQAVLRLVRRVVAGSEELIGRIHAKLVP